MKKKRFSQFARKRGNSGHQFLLWPKRLKHISVSQNITQFLELKSIFPKQKSVSQNIHQFPEIQINLPKTQINFPKHKFVSVSTDWSLPYYDEMASKVE